MTAPLTRFLKKGKTYSNDLLPSIRPHVGKCKYCSAPVLFAPVIRIMVNNFLVLAFKLIDSTEGEHHCFEYKIGKALENGQTVFKNF